MADRPNILLILTDQWRRQALGCNGDPVIRTPHIDGLAAQGVNLQRCYTTDPVCTPARAALQTGRYPHQTGLITNNLYFREGELGVAACLADAGYATGYIGKWHLCGSDRPGFVPPEHRVGFEYFVGFNRGHAYHEPVYFTNEGELRQPGGFEPTYQTDLALDFVAAHSHGPFFLMVSYGPPHMPYRPPEGFDRVTPEDLVWRPNVPQDERADPETIRDLCGYYGLGEAVDAEVGRLLEHLAASGGDDDTIVVFTSDHGDMHGCHGMHYKGKPQEESLGIPLIARGPGIPPGATPNGLASTVDVPPALLSLGGVPIPESMSGRDISPLLRGEDLEIDSVYCEGRMNVRDAVGSDTPGSPPEAPTSSTSRANPRGGGQYRDWRAIVTPRYKLAVDYTGEVVWLTDLRDDPYELRNLANLPEASSVQEELLARLRERGLELGDPFPERVEPAPGD